MAEEGRAEMGASGVEAVGREGEREDGQGAGPRRRDRCPDGEAEAPRRQRQDGADWRPDWILRADRLELELTETCMVRDFERTLPRLEALIEAGQYLPDVVNDLSAFVEDHPAETRIHRLLGDAYLRRGRLKEALYSFRKALEQL